MPYDVVKTLLTEDNSSVSDTSLKIRRQFVADLSSSGTATLTAGTNEIFTAHSENDVTVSIMSKGGSATEGEVGDVIVGGVTPPSGKSIWEQSRWIAEDQELRSFMLHEPRGGVFRHVNLLVPPILPDADIGWIIMEPEDTPPMSGSNSICVSLSLIHISEPTRPY